MELGPNTQLAAGASILALFVGVGLLTTKIGSDAIGRVLISFEVAQYREAGLPYQYPDTGGYTEIPVVRPNGSHAYLHIPDGRYPEPLIVDCDGKTVDTDVSNVLRLLNEIKELRGIQRPFNDFCS